MSGHWLPHAASGLVRAARVRWATRDGFTVGEVPAFHPDAVAWFRDAITKVSHYIEYGSGASTLLAAQAGVRTLSMEGDPRYAMAVRAALPTGAPVDLFDAGLGLTAEWSFPVYTRPTAARLACWRAYAQVPLAKARAEGWSPGLVLVDGRFRRSCALHAAQAVVAAGGSATLFFDDYTPRPHYNSVEALLGAPRIVGTSALFAIGAGTASADADFSESLLADAAKDFR
jgi:hypothetical protein